MGKIKTREPAVYEFENRLIVHDNPHPIRLLISVPFFIGGGYFFYHLFNAIYVYILDASAGEWMSALPGMLFMAVLGAAISFPGLLLASRESLVVNKELNVAGKRRGLLGLHTRGKLVYLDQVRKVICRQQTRNRNQRTVGSTSGRSTSNTFYLIEFEMNDDQVAPLIEFQDKPGARKVAKAVAGFAELELDNRI
ncbi:hypothetical protein ACFL1S_03340 [Pseudomonadota bacterium]